MIKNSLIFAFFSFLINSINFILIPIYTKQLTVQEYGTLASITIFITIFTALFTFGLNGAINKMYFDLSNNELEDEFITTSFLTKIFLSTFILLIFVLNNGLFLNNVFKNINYNPFLKYSIFISYLNVFSVVPLSILLVRGNALKYRILTSIYFILNTICTLYNLLVLKSGLIGIFHAQLFANLLMSIYYSYNILIKKPIKFNKNISFNLIIFGFPILLYTLTGMLIEQSSKILIERLLSLKELGIYNLAFQFSSIIVILNSAINMAWVPIYFKVSKLEQNSNLFHLFSKYLFILISFIALLISIYQKYVLYFLLSKNYENAEIYIPILVYVFVITNTYWILLVNPIFQSNQIKLLPFIAILSGAISIFSCNSLIPRFGLYGAIISVFIGNLFMNFITYYFIKRKMTLRYNNTKLILIVSISIAFFLISTLIKNSNIYLEILMNSIVILFFILTIWFFKIFDFNEFKFLKNNI